MSLNVDFVKLHCFCPVTFYICFHFHGNMSGQNWKQQAFLKLKALIIKIKYAAPILNTIQCAFISIVSSRVPLTDRTCFT